MREASICRDAFVQSLSFAALVSLVAACSSADSRPRPGLSLAAPAPWDPLPAVGVDDSQLSMATPADVAAKRRQLVQFLWGRGGVPEAQMPASIEYDVPNPIGASMANLARVDRLVIDMGQNVKNETFHFVPERYNGQLVIVQQGHDGSLADIGVGETIVDLVESGYGVLGALMPCFNSFPCPIQVTAPGAPHDDLIAQVVPPTGNVIKFFVEHLVVSMNYLRAMSAKDHFPSYQAFHMTGVSGGGWTTVIYSAIDPSVRISVPVSGSKPMYLRWCPPPGCSSGSEGDREQTLFPLYQTAGYLDLYALGAAGPGRRQIQVQIRHDGCCFGEEFYDATNGVPGLTWEQAVRAYEAKIQDFFGTPTDSGWFRFEIDETSSGMHRISPATRVQVLLAELEGDRRPVGALRSSDVFARGPDGRLEHQPPIWTSLAATVIGSPSVAGESDLFARDASSHLVHGSRVASSWAFESWPGVLSSDPAALAGGSRLDVVAIEDDSRLWHWSLEGGRISTEVTDATTEVLGVPALVGSGPDRLHAFARRSDGGLQHVFTRGADWKTEQVGAMQIVGYPAAVASDDGSLHVFAHGADGALWEGSLDGDGAPWRVDAIDGRAAAIGVAMAGSPSARIDASGALFVFSRTRTADLATFKSGSAGWTFTPIPRPASPLFTAGGFAHSPAAVPDGVFMAGSSGYLWLYAEAPGWQWMGGRIP